jgi:hypothetical protein
MTGTSWPWASSTMPVAPAPLTGSRITTEAPALSAVVICWACFASSWSAL